MPRRHHGCVEAFKLTGRRLWLVEARRAAWWDARKIGLSPPPIETDEGWLIIYHGVRHTAAGCLYRLGLAPPRPGGPGPLPPSGR